MAISCHPGGCVVTHPPSRPLSITRTTLHASSPLDIVGISTIKPSGRRRERVGGRGEPSSLPLLLPPPLPLLLPLLFPPLLPLLLSPPPCILFFLVVLFSFFLVLFLVRRNLQSSFHNSFSRGRARKKRKRRKNEGVSPLYIVRISDPPKYGVRLFC